MSVNEMAEEKPRLIAPLPQAQGLVEIPGSPDVVLQTLDLARHVALDPDGKRYVVATYNDTHMGRKYVTSVYPQQNSYLTMFRLVLHNYSSDNAEQAIQKHIETVRAIQQGKLK
jgi:hypothetical protein